MLDIPALASCAIYLYTSIGTAGATVPLPTTAPPDDDDDDDDEEEEEEEEEHPAAGVLTW